MEHQRREASEQNGRDLVELANGGNGKQGDIRNGLGKL
jgi:hypothetical protein